MTIENTKPNYTHANGEKAAAEKKAMLALIVLFLLPSTLAVTITSIQGPLTNGQNSDCPSHDTNPEDNRIDAGELATAITTFI